MVTLLTSSTAAPTVQWDGSLKSAVFINHTLQRSSRHAFASAGQSLPVESQRHCASQLTIKTMGSTTMKKAVMIDVCDCCGINVIDATNDDSIITFAKNNAVRARVCSTCMSKLCMMATEATRSFDDSDNCTKSKSNKATLALYVVERSSIHEQ